MKLTRLQTVNFLGARDVDVTLATPVTLFTGRNGSGKSSVQEAVRMALTGETVRVDLKKDYADLLTDGNKSGCIKVWAEDPTIPAWAVTLPEGKSIVTHDKTRDAALACVMDAQHFARMDADARRSFLFRLMGLSATGEVVQKRLLDKGCEAALVESIVPMVARSGFPKACDEAKARAREQKAAWRTITGETYGEKKAEAWAAEKPAFDAVELADATKQLEETQAALEKANQELGALQADCTRHAEVSQRLEVLREKGSHYARIASKLAHDEEELKVWTEKVEATRRLAGGERRTGLVHDFAYAVSNILFAIPIQDPNDDTDPSYDADAQRALVKADLVLENYEKEYGEIEDDLQPDPEAAEKLPEYEKALQLLQNSVANDRRDLEEANAAASALSSTAESIGHAAPTEQEIKDAVARVNSIKEQRTATAERLNILGAAKRQSEQAEKRTTEAQAAHRAVLAWTAIADALDADGIPGEMLGEALEPINSHLDDAAFSSWLLKTRIEPDMSITATYQRPEWRPHHYDLLSESEKWRVDAMIAEAISRVSGLKILVLDRFDVLDLHGRSDLISWLDYIATKGEIDTALIFGTLKALPSGLPDTCASYWLDNGTVMQQQLKEAA